MRRLTIVIIVMLFGFGVLNGATYYVDNSHPQANDSNPGTESLPWEHSPGMPGWSGSAELQAGDAVYFNSECTWTVSSGDAIIQVAGGVTYDGKTWGSGSRAILQATV
ncbi:hypothetical protein KAX75_12525, partial [candidate division WOR-3 bacterium]|nr:hypothetical protein [candidate division WOR-3 bacterium]